MYRIEAVRLDGSKRVLADWFPNLITNNGLDLIGYNSNLFNNCYIGSGNTPPSVLDTALNALVGSAGQTGNVRSAQSSPPYYGSFTLTYQFAMGVAAGNLSEVGIGPSATSLFSRALILDGGGSPTTITVLPSEALNVTYQIQLYVPTTDTTGTVNISGVTYNYVCRAATATDAGSWSPVGATTFQALTVGFAATTLPAITDQIQWTGGFDTLYGGGQPYVGGAYAVQGIFNMGLGDANFGGGINAFDLMMSAGFGRFSFVITPAIMKTGSQTLSLNFQTSWSVYAP